MSSFISFSLPYFEATIHFIVFAYVFETYVRSRQHKCYQITDRPSSISDEIATEERFRKAQAYGYDKSTFGFVVDFVETSKGLLFLYMGFLPFWWKMSGVLVEKMGVEGEIYQSVVFFVTSSIFETLMAIPMQIYGAFVIEEKHGFNKQTMKIFFMDIVKSMVLTFLLGSPILALFLRIVRWGGDMFYIYVSVFLFVVQLIMVAIYPTLIQPCFNKVKPLEESELKTKIEELADSVSFPLKSIYEMDGSTRSSHSNAYQYGFCSSKHIVLFDTLIQQANVDEIVAIVGHELGHWKLGHTIKTLIISQIQTLVLMFLFGFALNSKELYSAFGFETQPTIIGFMLFSYIYAPVSHITNFLMHAQSRKFEFEADAFAVGLGKGNDLRNGLIKIQKENLGTYVTDWLYSAYTYSHPPLLERLAAISKNITSETKKQE